jgi:hypothetical protein
MAKRQDCGSASLLIRIRIQLLIKCVSGFWLFTLMRIQILLIRVRRISYHLFTDPPGLHLENLCLHCENPLASGHGSILSLWGSWILNLMPIRIQLFTLMRIRIQLPKNADPSGSGTLLESAERSSLDIKRLLVAESCGNEPDERGGVRHDRTQASCSVPRTGNGYPNVSF